VVGGIPSVVPAIDTPIIKHKINNASYS